MADQDLHDVVIVGAGAMGSAAAWALSKTGRDVVAVEQYELGHARGGSHGATRIFRLGTEQAHYVEIAQRAQTLWAQLAAETGDQLLTATGAIEHGLRAEQIETFASLLTAHGVENEVLQPDAAMARWTGMRFEEPVLHQSIGGILHADRAVAGLQRLAADDGVDLRGNAGAQAIHVLSDDEVVVETAAGEVRAKRAIVTVGSWAAKVLSGLVELPTITVTQEQPRVFTRHDDAANGWPCFVHWRDEDVEFGTNEGYGLVEAGVGYKVGLHRSGAVIDPDVRDFKPEPARDAALHAYVERWFPGLDPTRSVEISCLYDNSPSYDFVIDRIGPVTLATGFSGEGFKFVPYVGELLRDLALDLADPPELFTLAHHAAT